MVYNSADFSKRLPAMLVYYRSSSIFAFYIFCIFYNIIQGYAQYITKDGLARIKSVLCLLEIVSFRILIHIVSYFVDAGQRVQDTQIGRVCSSILFLNIYTSFTRSYSIRSVKRSRCTRVM